MDKISGGCLCGGVRYRVQGPLRPILQCHCEMCRRATGGLWRATMARRTDLEIEDDGRLAWYGSSPGVRRGFCRTCGASLFWSRQDSPTIGITAGTLDQPTGLELAVHIHVDSAADYERIADGLPQVADGRHGIEFP